MLSCYLWTIILEGCRDGVARNLPLRSAAAWRRRWRLRLHQRHGHRARQDFSRARENVDRGHDEGDQALDAVDSQGLLQVEGPPPHEHLSGVVAHGGGVRPASASTTHVSGGESVQGHCLGLRREIAMAERAQEAFAMGVDMESSFPWLVVVVVWLGRAE